MTKLTIKEVAIKAGVSTATISRVLNGNGYVSAEARKRVLETVEGLQYKPNTIARSLKQERTGGIGFVMPDLTNPYFMHISRRLQQKLAEQNYYFFFMDSGEHLAKEREALNFLLEKRVEAILLSGTGGNIDLLQTIQNNGIPLVLLDRQISEFSTDVVMDDNVAAAKMAVRYLAEQGHRHIGLLNGPNEIATAIERKEGAMAGLLDAGIPIEDKFHYVGDYTKASGVQAVRYFMGLDSPTTALFSANNEMTFGLFLGLKEMGLALDAVEVVSFGELEFAKLFPHRMKAIHQDPIAVADAAAELLLRRLIVGERHGHWEKRVIVPRLE